MKDPINTEQWNFCTDQANELAKIIMTKDISSVFDNEGNANFCLTTNLILTAGIIVLLSKQINIAPGKMLDIFCDQVRCLLKNNKDNLSVFH